MMDITKLKSVEDLATFCHAEGTYFDHELLAINFAVANLEKFRQLAIQDYVDSLEPVGFVREWISIKDRLPEVMKVVAVLVPSWGNIPYTAYIDDDGDWCEADGDLMGSGFNAISHWFELPKIANEKNK